MKEYIFHFYKSGEVRFIKSISAETIELARLKAANLFCLLDCYDEYGLSSWE